MTSASAPRTSAGSASCSVWPSTRRSSASAVSRSRALASASSRRAALLGPRLARLLAEVGPFDLAALGRPLVGIDDRHGMPPEVAARILPQLEAAAAAARARLGC